MLHSFSVKTWIPWAHTTPKVSEAVELAFCIIRSSKLPDKQTLKNEKMERKSPKWGISCIHRTDAEPSLHSKGLFFYIDLKIGNIMKYKPYISAS